VVWRRKSTAAGGVGGGWLFDDGYCTARESSCTGATHAPILDNYRTVVCIGRLLESGGAVYGLFQSKRLSEMRKNCINGTEECEIVICAMQYCERAKSSPSYSPSKNSIDSFNSSLLRKYGQIKSLTVVSLPSNNNRTSHQTHKASSPVASAHTPHPNWSRSYASRARCRSLRL